ncbi:MAG: hypothetical protein K6T66_10865 [Peptococcaceae bacterium]|nr:hypothetical protein [Peptococcaceae bacterium]
MDNARLLDDRLRRIIREVSTRTGGEIKVQMVEDFTRAVDRITSQAHRRQALSFMTMLKKSLEELE